jgi:hypothetical protein
MDAGRRRQASLPEGLEDSATNDSCVAIETVDAHVVKDLIGSYGENLSVKRLFRSPSTMVGTQDHQMPQ